MSTSSCESEMSPFSSDDGSDNENQNQSYAHSLMKVGEEYDEAILQLMKEYASSNAQSSQVPKRRKYVERKRELGHAKLFEDYFADPPVYTDYQFRRRFRMRRHLFIRIMERLQSEIPYFKPKVDATGRSGLSTLQQCTAALRVLAYGIAMDAVDEYVRIGETTTRRCLEAFVEGVISLFGEEYLRKPNEADIQRLLHVGEQRGFPGMLGSIDCMHWEWKNCPVAWQGQYASGRYKKPTIILEAVASSDLWFWHAFFGTPGTCNDINVLNRSPVFDDIFEDRAPPVQFTVNNHSYNMGYYLTDGIYPPWATFVQSISLPQGPKAKLFAQRQESVRKDVERAFGVLQARFAIVRQPCNFWSPPFVGKVMKACIILHNMIVEDERDTYADYCDPSHWDEVEIRYEDGSRWTYTRGRVNDMETYIRNRTRVRDRRTNECLKDDLVENIWQMFG